MTFTQQNQAPVAPQPEPQPGMGQPGVPNPANPQDPNVADPAQPADVPPAEPALADPFAPPAPEGDEGQKEGEGEANPGEMTEEQVAEDYAKQVADSNFIDTDTLNQQFAEAARTGDFSAATQSLRDSVNSAITQALLASRHLAKEAQRNMQGEIEQTVNRTTEQNSNVADMRTTVSNSFPEFSKHQRDLSNQIYSGYIKTMPHKDAVQSTIKYLSDITGVKPVAEAGNRPPEPNRLAGIDTSLGNAFKQVNM